MRVSHSHSHSHSHSLLALALALALAPALAHAQETEPTHAARVLTLPSSGPSPDAVPQPHGEAPAGYRIESHPNWPLVVAGAGTFLASYAVALISALTVSSDTSALCTGSAPMTVNMGSTPRPECFHDFQLAAIPIVGPFLVYPSNVPAGTTVPYGSLDPGWAIGLAIDAISQIAGLALFVIGFVDEQRTAVHDSDHASMRLRIGGGPTSISATLTF